MLEFWDMFHNFSMVSYTMGTYKNCLVEAMLINSLKVYFGKGNLFLDYPPFSLTQNYGWNGVWHTSQPYFRKVETLTRSLHDFYTIWDNWHSSPVTSCWQLHCRRDLWSSDTTVLGKMNTFARKITLSENSLSLVNKVNSEVKYFLFRSNFFLWENLSCESRSHF